MTQKYDTIQIRGLARRGLTWRQICQELGCCEETVRRALVDDIDAFREKENIRQKAYRKRKKLAIPKETRTGQIASKKW